MRPLSPEERAEILSRHPGAGEDDLQRFDELLVERVVLERLAFDAPGELSEADRLARVAAIEAALDELSVNVFPHWDDAVAAVAARRLEADDDEPPIA